jgi:hypothetical protein
MKLSINVGTKNLKLSINVGTKNLKNLTEVFLNLTEFLPYLFLSCKANARVKLTKTGHGPNSSTLVIICVVLLLFVLYYVLFVCKCVLPPGDNPIAVNKYINIKMYIYTYIYTYANLKFRNMSVFTAGFWSCIPSSDRRRRALRHVLLFYNTFLLNSLAFIALKGGKR